MSVDRLETVRQQLAEGKHAQAEATARRWMQSSPKEAAAAHALGLALREQGKIEQSLFFARQALALDPTAAALMVELGRVLGRMNRHAEAIDVLTRAIDRDTSDVDAWALLASSLEHADRFTDVERVAREGLAQFPHEPRLTSRLVTAVVEQGRPQEAVELFRAALFARPDDVGLAGHLAAIMNYQAPADREGMSAAHRNYGRLLTQSRFVKPFVHSRPARGAWLDRPLRIGFLSGDLREHPVSAFLLPALEHLDREQFITCCYHTHTQHDDTSTRVAATVSRGGSHGAGGFVNVHGLDDVALARRIAADQIDVLVELSGLSPGHRLGAVALKPASVIVTYCGYPNTTGVPGVDYRLVDSITDPPGSERFATEALYRLDPCFLCFRPPDDAPPVAPSPIQASGVVTFGSFNAVLKINDEVVRTWTMLLERLPAARLMIKAFALRRPAMRSALLARFAAAGADTSRIVIFPPTSSVRDHLATYGQIDVALDTFPYSGTTTTAELLHMGVPLVTLCPPDGPHASRVSASLLAAVGLNELITDSTEAYLQRGQSLAQDAARLTAMRTTLRERLRTSPLGDQPAFARRFGAAMLAMWTHWASGGEPETFAQPESAGAQTRARAEERHGAAP